MSLRPGLQVYSLILELELPGLQVYSLILEFEARFTVSSLSLRPRLQVYSLILDLQARFTGLQSNP